MVVQGVGFRRCRHPSFEVSAPRLPALLCYTMNMQKRILNKWVIYGRVSGFALGFNVDKYGATIDLGFWYVGLEF
jgi:hypothetical protein